MNSTVEHAQKLLLETPDLTDSEVAHLTDVIDGRSTSLFFRCRIVNSEPGVWITPPSADVQAARTTQPAT